VDGDLVFAMSSDGDLACFDAAGGEKRWAKHLRNDFGGAMNKWAYAESPLVDGDLLICTPGGSRATLLALNKRSGAEVWRGPVPGGDKAAYASIVSGEVGGVRMYIQLLAGGVVGVEAKTGKFLWRTTNGINKIANIPTPVFLDDRVFVSTGYGGGAAQAKLAASKGGVSATHVWASKKLANQIGGVVVVGDYLYGTNGQALLCLEFATGKEKWSNRAVGQGAMCYADGRLYVRGEKSNEVVLVEANPEKYVEKGRFTQPERSSKPAWPYPVVANGRLYLRDRTILLCYDVKRPQ
jgi:outer membrane protein assembly factor BamB